MENIRFNSKLKDVQKVQVEILKEFDRICKKYDIKYQLFAGTLLGAIRHKGFIPWDDDIDVCLLRSDYEKFLKVCNSDLNEKYFLQNYETDKNYNAQFSKIRKNDTLFIEKITSDSNIHKGIYIDIFPLDNILKDKFLGKLHQKILYILGRVNLTRIKKLCLQRHNPLNKIFSLTIHNIMNCVPKIWFDKLQTKVATIFNNKKTGYVSHLTNGVSKVRYDKFTFEKKYINDIIFVEFENELFPISKDYHKILTQLYGDYFKLPPINEQKPHHGVIKIELNTSDLKDV